LPPYVRASVRGASEVSEGLRSMYLQLAGPVLKIDWELWISRTAQHSWQVRFSRSVENYEYLFYEYLWLCSIALAGPVLKVGWELRECIGSQGRLRTMRMYCSTVSAGNVDCIYRAPQCQLGTSITNCPQYQLGTLIAMLFHSVNWEPCLLSFHSIHWEPWLLSFHSASWEPRSLPYLFSMTVENSNQHIVSSQWHLRTVINISCCHTRFTNIIKREPFYRKLS